MKNNYRYKFFSFALSIFLLAGIFSSYNFSFNSFDSLRSFELFDSLKSLHFQANTANADSMPVISYRTHVQTFGWQNYVSDGATSGTEGKSKRLEAIQITVSNIPSNLSGGISYRTHVQTYGWQSWVSNGAMSGTSGEAKRLEAIQIKFTGTLANNYDVIYRVHAQSFGWLSWAKNGESAGTSGYAKRLEGIQIKAVTKNSVSTSTSSAYINYADAPKIRYNLYSQTYEWLEGSENGGVIGVIGDSKRIEGAYFKITDNKGYNGGLVGKAYVQKYGWLNSQSGTNNYAGTSGQGLRMEAFQLKLTGSLATNFDIYYRVYVQNMGWLSWAKNGGAAGSFNYGARIEGLQIVITHKGANSLPAGFSGTFNSPCKTNTSGVKYNSATTSTDKRIPNYTGSKTTNYNVNYSYTSYNSNFSGKVTLSISKDMYSYYKGLRRYSNNYTKYSTKYINDKNNLAVANSLISAIKNSYYDYYGTSPSNSDIAYEAMRLIQGMTYKSDMASRGYADFPKYPIETLFDNGGDCEDTAILYATVLKQLGIGVVLIEFDDHMAVGVKGDESIAGSYYTYKGSRYYYVETTSTWDFGELPDEYHGISATIIPVNV